MRIYYLFTHVIVCDKIVCWCPWVFVSLSMSVSVSVSVSDMRRCESVCTYIWVCQWFFSAYVAVRGPIEPISWTTSGPRTDFGKHCSMYLHVCVYVCVCVFVNKWLYTTFACFLGISIRIIRIHLCCLCFKRLRRTCMRARCKKGCFNFINSLQAER